LAPAKIFDQGSKILKKCWSDSDSMARPEASTFENGFLMKVARCYSPLERRHLRLRLARVRFAHVFGNAVGRDYSRCTQPS